MPLSPGEVRVADSRLAFDFRPVLMPLPSSSTRPDGRKVRYAAVGAGWITQEDFLPGVSNSGNSIVAAIVTGDRVKADALGRKYGAPCVGYDGYDELLRSGEIDAVYLGLPNHLHRDFAVRALDAGVHVLCEKPMAPTEEDCRAMIAAGERTRARLMIAYRLHFEPGYVAALEAVYQGRLGDPRIFSSVFSQQVSPENHRTKPELWAGPLPDMGVYQINAARHFFAAEPEEVFAWACHRAEARFAGVEEMISALLRFPGGGVAQLTVSFGARSVARLSLAGTEGCLEVSPGYGWSTPRIVRLNLAQGVEEKEYPQVDQFGGETQYFSNCILDGQEPEPDGWEGLADVRVIKALESSLRSARPERVESLPPRPRRPSREQVVALPPVPPGELVRARPPE